MSFETWKAEFYPIPADKVKKKDAIAHSLQKWIGLRKKNIKKHAVLMELLWDIPYIFDDSRSIFSALSINADSCSLCHVYQENGGDCLKCPISQERGGIRCDRETPKEELSPYGMFVHNQNPEPMIKILQICLDKVNQKKGAV
jgi:hypothetical protein